MPCRLFHDWSKWGAVKTGHFHHVSAYGEHYEDDRDYQERTCNRCGEYQWRFA